MRTRQLTGLHVLGGFVLAFGIIVAVNLTLAFKAVATFPGLETRNSYVASQAFDRERAAQEALGWTMSSNLSSDRIEISFRDAAGPVTPMISEAILARPNTLSADQPLELRSMGNGLFAATVDAATGRWQLRLKANAADGTEFRQRLSLWVSR